MSWVDIRLKSTAGRGLLLGTVLGSSLATLDGSVVNVALPHIGRDLHAPLWGLQWTVNAYLLPLAAFVLLGGALGDRFGRRKIFLLGVVWFTGASVLCGFATGIGWLVGARALQGIGSALLTPGSLVLDPVEPASRRSGAGHRPVGRSRRRGQRRRPAARRLPDRRAELALDLLHQRAARRSSRSWPRCASSRRAATPTRPGRFDVAGAALGAIGLGGITFALVEGVLWAGSGGRSGAGRVHLVGTSRGRADDADGALPVGRVQRDQPRHAAHLRRARRPDLLLHPATAARGRASRRSRPVRPRFR